MELSIQECLFISYGLNELNPLVNIKTNEIIKEAPSFPAKFSLRMADLESEITPKLKNYYKVQTDTYKKYGEEQEVDGKKMIIIKPENKEIFAKEIQALLDEKFKINFEPLSVDIFDNVSLSKDFFINIKSVRKV